MAKSTYVEGSSVKKYKFKLGDLVRTKDNSKIILVTAPQLLEKTFSGTVVWSVYSGVKVGEHSKNWDEKQFVLLEEGDHVRLRNGSV